MANIVYNNQPLNEKVSTELYREFVASNKSIARGLVTPDSDIKYKKTLRKYLASYTLKNRSAKLNPDVAAEEVDGNLLTLSEVSLHKEISFQDAYKYIQDPAISPGVLVDYEDQAVLDGILQAHLEALDKDFGVLDWLGKGANPTKYTFTDAYDGFLPTMLADTNVNVIPVEPTLTITNITKGTTTILTISGGGDKVFKGDIVTLQNNIIGIAALIGLSGKVISVSPTSVELAIDSSAMTGTFSGTATAVCINKLNVFDVLEAVVNNTPDAVKENGARIYVPMRIWEQYGFALAKEYVGTMVGEKQKDFNGYIIEPMTDFLPNVILMTSPRNLVVGYDLNEFEAEVLWLGDTTADKVYAVRIEAKRGVQYVFSNEISIIKPAIPN